eukprot:gnl/MRDRNA2_/MRDRNA2_77269_c0_seq1.p1 gnl/MRDRNA2_/MRDRNA2_77269_c0~~gnl/MRDRNA2_/MRDRNA2_77269_c0_seq1.p1  ORF type:complete len:337 (+),score=45.51 gnl/MRDRNA2_/MRDRNA2_77269_c0_seq1:91-1101(+)
MEKFRQFADPGTGVNPFVPAWANYRSPIYMRLVKYLIMLPVALARCILLLVALLFLCLGSSLCVIPVGPVRYPLQRIFYFLGCRMGLTALGILSVSTAAADHRRLKCRPSAKEISPASDAKHGRMVLSNYQGIADVLYYGMKLSPTFVFPSVDGSPVALGLLGALKQSTQSKPLPKSKDTLTQILEKASSGWEGPVVVFAEGAKTNGSAILSWKSRTFQGCTKLEKPNGTLLACLEYSRTGAYTAHHTVGGPAYHIWNLCFQPWQSLSAIWLAGDDLAASIKDKEVDEQVDLARTFLVRMLPGAVSVDLVADKHEEFLGYWYKFSSAKQYAGKKKS